MPPSISQIKTGRQFARINMDSSGTATVTVDVGDGYRMGVPGPLLPLPLDDTPIDPTNKLASNQDLLRQEIRGQLSAHNVDWYSLNIVYRRLPCDYSCKKRPTAVIVAKRDGGSRQWVNFLETISGVLERLGYAELNVEIVDPIARFGKSTKPILVSGPVVSGWPALRKKILAILGDHAWYSLQVLLRGYAGDTVEMKPTIFISVQNRNSALWHGLKARIQGACESTSMPEGTKPLRVEIVRGGSVWKADQLLSMGEFVSMANGSFPVVNGGSSVGHLGNTGTLGGYMSISQPGQAPQTFGVTNYHVVKTEAMTHLHNRNGFPNAVQAKCAVRMFSPSDNDKLATVGAIQSSLDLGQRDFENLKQKGEYSQDDTTKKTYDAANLRRQEFANQKLAILGSDTQFGTVFAASGFRKTPAGLALDWALISPPGNRIGKNLLPGVLDFGVGVNVNIINKTTIDAWSDDCWRGKNELVFKKGRSTGLTWGNINGLKTDIHFMGEPNGKVWSAYDIVSANSKDFSMGGDSGSFVLDSDGQLAGLLFAGSEPLVGHEADLRHGYVIPIGSVIDNIEAMTGGKVSLP